VDPRVTSTLQGSLMRQTKIGRFLTRLGILLFVAMASSCQGVALLDPQGPIAAQERDLILMAVGLALIIIVPVFIMVIWFAIRYRETNTKATYKPHWEGNLKLEVLIWLIPILIIGVLSYLTWVKTTDLDPYKPIVSTEKPVHVQVVSLDWNWLFIYPDEQVASLNKLVIPAGAPVTFDLTSATVMSSMFIPELGTQMYVMAGMVTHLNLLSDKPGHYVGHNMEFTGIGYSAMSFAADAVTKGDYATWLQDAKSKGNPLSTDEFNKLNKPQAGLAATTYGSVEPNLFGHIVGEFLKPMADATKTDGKM